MLLLKRERERGREREREKRKEQILQIKSHARLESKHLAHQLRSVSMLPTAARVNPADSESRINIVRAKRSTGVLIVICGFSLSHKANAITVAA